MLEKKNYMDNFFANIFRKREAVPVSPTDTGAVSTSGRAEKVGSGSYRERIVYARDSRVALTVSAVYRAIELRANTIGQMPVQLRKKDTEKGNFTPIVKGLGKDTNYLLQIEPNPLMSAFELWKQVTIDRLVKGNGFVYIERNVFDEPVKFWLADCAGYNEITGLYNLKYLSDHGIKIKVDVPRSDVLHFPNTYKRQDSIWGISTLQYAFETLTLIKTQKNQALETAAKGGRLKMLVQEKDAQPVGTRGRANQAEMKKITRQFNLDMYDGDAIFLNNVADAKPISLSAQDMQMIDMLNMGQDDVARFFGTPRPLLMLDTNSHYNDYQNATMEYLQRTIAADRVAYQQEIYRKLVGLDDYGEYDVHVCEKPLLAMDLERQAKVDQLNLQAGTMTVNEIRAEHDMPAVENGDIVYISTNLAELGSAKLRDSGGSQTTNPNLEENENKKE